MRKPLRALLSLNDPGWGRNQNSGDDGQRPNDQRPKDQRPGSSDGPPDLDELWRDLNRRINNLLGRGGGGQTPPGGPDQGDGPNMRGAAIGLGILGLVGLVLWGASGIYIIREGQSSVELRFGQFVQQVDRAGITIRWPYPIMTHELVSTQQLRTVEIGYRNAVGNKNLREALMLTADKAIVDIQFAMQYRVGNAKDYLFNNRMGNVPEEIVRQAGEAAMREIVGKAGINQVLFEEKDLVAQRTRELVQTILDRYALGITLVDVTIQQAQPPEQVQAAFEDVNKAAQERKRMINEGQSYANDVIPKARGAAARILQEAQGYREAVVAEAKGDAERFARLLAEYEKSPRVTRDRLYLETMQEVLSKSSKLFMDSKAANNMLYMPLDKILQQSGPVPRPAPAAQPPVSVNPAASARRESAGRASRDRDAMRNRDRSVLR